MKPHAPDQFESLMEDVLAEMANPPALPGLTERLLKRSSNMQMVLSRGQVNEPLFSTLDELRGGSRNTIAYALLLHLAAILLITLAVHTARQVLPAPVQTSLVELPPLPPPPLAPKKLTMGGGGGNPGAAPVSKGIPPKFAAEGLNPPKAPPTVAPKISVPVTVDVQQDLKMAKVDVPNIGMPNSPLVGMSLGNGRGAGIGGGAGAGIGPGTGGNYGGGVRRIGGGVSAPVALFTPEPEFSEEARKAKVAGNVLVYLQVDEQGKPSHVRVLRGIGLGLDERAVAAVQQYRFRPAMENGKPVRVEMNVDVGFQIF